jgi:hypothetical protein
LLWSVAILCSLVTGCVAPVDVELPNDLRWVATLKLADNRIVRGSKIFEAPAAVHVDNGDVLVGWTAEDLGSLLAESQRDDLREAQDCELVLPFPRLAYRLDDGGEIDPIPPSALPPLTLDAYANRCPCSGMIDAANFLDVTSATVPDSAEDLVRWVEPREPDSLILQLDGPSAGERTLEVRRGQLALVFLPSSLDAHFTAEGAVWRIGLNGSLSVSTDDGQLARDRNGRLGAFVTPPSAWKLDVIYGVTDRGEVLDLMEGTSLIDCDTSGEPSMTYWRTATDLFFGFHAGPQHQLCWIRNGVPAVFASRVETPATASTLHPRHGLLVAEGKDILAIAFDGTPSTFFDRSTFRGDVVALANWGPGIILGNTKGDIEWFSPASGRSFLHTITRIPRYIIPVQDGFYVIARGRDGDPPTSTDLGFHFVPRRTCAL